MAVASSDASNLRNTTAVKKNGKLILNGHKWVSRSAGFGLRPIPSPLPHSTPASRMFHSSITRLGMR